MCVGETVKRGEVVPRVGDPGWSTSPQVWSEGVKYGRAINPASFIGRGSRTLAQVIKGS